MGVGRNFTENFSAALSFGYETAQGGLASNLSPTDGYFSVGLGGTYSFESSKLSAGVRYVNIGDATAEGGSGITADFTDSKAWGVGLQYTMYLN